ncbi:MAG: polysaccharide deacetylase family protein, partial [Candidatus Dadabacteria bacterium]|nr:polysaccharide deacetylase family protein [Candidatus Dadabacteria bacterium]
MKIALTFDDCYDSHLLFVKPLLEAYGFTATFFVSGHYLTCCKKFQPKHLVDFDRGGFELGNHLNAHIDMTKCGLQHNILQIKSVNDLFCKLGIETAISLAYPGYHVNNSTKEAVKRAGIKFARGGN